MMTISFPYRYIRKVIILKMFLDKLPKIAWSLNNLQQGHLSDKAEIEVYMQIGVHAMSFVCRLCLAQTLRARK